VSLYRVTRRRVDLGFGDAPPIWSCTVEAESEEQIRHALQARDLDVMISIRQVSDSALSVEELLDLAAEGMRTDP